MMAVQPTNCRTFSAAKRRPPFWPKLIFTVSMALFPLRPPISPARKSRTQPMTCPTAMAAKPRAKPRGAKLVPVRISARETPAPNQMRPFWKVEVFLIPGPPRR
jgi:hypothetical protein